MMREGGGVMALPSPSSPILFLNCLLYFRKYLVLEKLFQAAAIKNRMFNRKQKILNTCL